MPPVQRPQPRHQLVEGERFHQVVVGAEVETADAVLCLVVGRQDQHVTIVAVAAQRRQHRESIDTGQHQVENDRIVGVGGDIGQRLFAIEGLIERKPLGLQPGGEGALQPL